MHDVHYISLGISTANLIISAVLLFVYAKNYRHIRSNYNLGLIIFSVLFFAQNLIFAHLSIFSWPYLSADIFMSHVILTNFIELLGLSTLLYITWR